MTTVNVAFCSNKVLNNLGFHIIFLSKIVKIFIVSHIWSVKESMTLNIKCKL